MTKRLGSDPVSIIKAAMASPTARQVLGTLSTKDLMVLSKANATGQLAKIATPILQATDPQAHAMQVDHPVAQVMAKLEPKHLRALAASCPPEGCPP